MENQTSWVTALGWVQTSSPFPGQAGVCPDSPAESLLVGRLDGSLCWLQVSLQDLHTDSTELTLCHRKEGEEDLSNWLCPNALVHPWHRNATAVFVP